MEYQVTLQVKGEDLKVGTLYVNARRGIETSSFRYDPAYLADRGAVPISPDLPLVDGSIRSQGQTLFGAFGDSMPDRWGRNLMLRAEKQAAKREARAQRALLESDYLVGVSDEARQGALRIWAGEKPVAQPGVGVPREVSIPDLLAAADRASADINADVSDLIAAGSSLGGARPKASVVDEKGYLCIAKFPKADESSLEDVCAWEKTALDLAGEFGIKVPETRLLRVADRSVLLLRRFDRNEKGRVHYISGMTAVQGADGGRYSYLDLVSFIEGEGASPREDIIELWKRILFSCAIGNIDDHMRNHGFLNAGGGWRLSPLFDVSAVKALLKGNLSEAFWLCVIYIKNMAVDVGRFISGAFSYGLTAGTQYVVAAIVAIALSVFCFSKKEKEQRPANIVFTITLWSVFAAIFLLLQKANEGGRHVWVFTIVGCILVFSNKWSKKTVIFGTWLIGILGVFLVQGSMVPTDYDVPVMDEALKSDVEYWERIFTEKNISAGEQLSYDNTCVWVLTDGDRITNHKELYALPEGMGISCCFADYVTENLDVLKSGYIATVAGGDIDILCGQSGWTEIGRTENVVVYQSH